MTYNENNYNDAPYNGGSPLTIVVSSDQFQYDNFGLQNTEIIVSDSDHSTPPTRDIKSVRVPREDGRLISGNFFGIKVIKLEGHVKSTSASAFEDLIQTIKKRLAVKDAILQITEANGTVKQWVANLRRPEQLFANRKSFHISFMPFTMEFLCVDPFAHDKDFTALFLGAQTADTINQTLTNTGDILAKLVLFMSVLSATGVTQIDIQNVTNGISMRITPTTVTAGDLFLFDSENRVVTQNGIAIDYDGAFIDLDPDDNNIQIDITGTDHEVELTYKHKNAYQ